MTADEEHGTDLPELEEVEDLEAPADSLGDVAGGKPLHGCDCSNGTSPQCPDPGTG
jgi:hypothetical protein